MVNRQMMSCVCSSSEQGRAASARHGAEASTPQFRRQGAGTCQDQGHHRGDCRRSCVSNSSSSLAGLYLSRLPNLVKSQNWDTEKLLFPSLCAQITFCAQRENNLIKPFGCQLWSESEEGMCSESRNGTLDYRLSHLFPNPDFCVQDFTVSPHC